MGSGNLQKTMPRVGALGSEIPTPPESVSRSTLQRSRTGRAGPAWAFSSVGKSARLITVRSVVRIHKGPRSDHKRARTTLGDVAQLGEHLLCKQGVAGSSPAISTGVPREIDDFVGYSPRARCQ